VESAPPRALRSGIGMTKLSEYAPDLEIGLAEIDRRLREIQLQLAPEREPRPARAPAGAAETPTGPAAATASERERSKGRHGPLASILERERRLRRAAGRGSELQAISELHEQLLASIRALLQGYEAMLGQRSGLSSASPTEAVTLSAGPFASTAALHEFEHALAGIPGVHGVAVRGFVGTDQAILEVQLAEPTS
jgi:hypothetical protein